MEIAKLELEVPHTYRHNMSLMTFTEFVDKYLDDEQVWIKRIPTKAALCGWRDVVCGDKALKKTARNIYDGRMRDTNLYVRYLEDQIMGGRPKLVDSSTQTNMKEIRLTKKLVSKGI